VLFGALKYFLLNVHLLFLVAVPHTMARTPIGYTLQGRWQYAGQPELLQLAGRRGVYVVRPVHSVLSDPGGVSLGRILVLGYVGYA
jgi:hypothetical protein